MHEFLRFQILNHPNFPGGGDNQGGTTKASMMKKTAKKSSMSVLHRTTISPMTSGGTRHHAYAVLTQADLETSLTSAMNMDMSLLLLEVCLMYHNMLDSRQVLFCNNCFLAVAYVILTHSYNYCLCRWK